MTSDIVPESLAHDNECRVIRDRDGRIVSYENLDYEQAMEVVCVKCGKPLTFNPDEDMVEEAQCCGINYRMYAQKYNIEIDRTSEEDEPEPKDCKHCDYVDKCRGQKADGECGHIEGGLMDKEE